MLFPRALVLASLASAASGFALQGARPHAGRRQAVRVAAAADKRVVVVGASGYIGKNVVKACVRRGYKTTAVVRDPAKAAQSCGDFFAGADVVAGDCTDPASIAAALSGGCDAMVSCLASRSGTKDDAELVDNVATRNALDAAKAAGAQNFVLLSAYCVRKPLLELQRAKLRFEEYLQATQGIEWSIVRPTAFFKSVSGQLELVQQGWPFVMFGDGEVCKCNPISEADLATYLIDCIDTKDRHGKILDLGGPDEPLSPAAQGKMLFDVVGKEPKFWTFPVALFDAIIGALAFLRLDDAAELGRIGKYYAVEDMVTTEPSEKFGTMTLKDHYERINVEGQEYDPYTTMFSGKKE